MTFASLLANVRISSRATRKESLSKRDQGRRMRWLFVVGVFPNWGKSELVMGKEFIKKAANGHHFQFPLNDVGINGN